MDSVVINIDTTINAPTITVEEVDSNIDINVEPTTISAEIKSSSPVTNITIDVSSTEIRAVIIEVERGVIYNYTSIKAEVDLNTAKVGITPQQSDDIIDNNSKVGITPQQSDDIIDNNSKVGITPQQSDDIIDNNSKVGITPQQSDDIIDNNAKLSATGTELEPNDINTLSKLNTILSDATLINTNDSRLSDARTPLPHTHIISDVIDLQSELDTKQERGDYQSKSADYQVLATDEAVAITTSGNDITLQTVGMADSQKVLIFNYSSGDNYIIGLIDGASPTTIGKDDAFGLMWNGSTYDLMFKKKDDSVIGGRTATYLEDFFTQSSINLRNIFESKLTNANDFFKQDLKLQHDGFAEDGLVGFILDFNYYENFLSKENKSILNLVNLGCTDDAEVKDANPNTNFGGQTSIIVTDPDVLGNGETIGLFQWDLTGLSDYTPTSVGSFNFNISSSGGGILARGINFTVSTQATSFFNENTVTFNNQPANGAIITTQNTSIPNNSTNLDISIPLTQSEINDCIGDFVFIKIERVDDLTDGAVAITSKEGTTFPKLSFNAEINY
jgi:hypothetical protein